LTTLKEPDMQEFIGIDLHSNDSVVVVADEEDRIVYRATRRPGAGAQAHAAGATRHRSDPGH
jgi:hypothetical protein